MTGEESTEDVRGSGEQRLNRLLTLIMDAAVEAIGFDGATMTVRVNDATGTVAATASEFVALDAAQYSDGEGPCLEAAEHGEPVTWSAADDEARWRGFQEVAEELGIATSLSMPLPIDDTMEIAASLNLYASERERVSQEQIDSALAFALQLAIALQTIDASKSTAAIARRAAQTIRSRAAIEQAKGVLMATEGLTPEQAAERLATMARDQQASARDVALRIISSRGPSEQDDDLAAPSLD